MCHIYILKLQHIKRRDELTKHDVSEDKMLEGHSN